MFRIRTLHQVVSAGRLAGGGIWRDVITSFAGSGLGGALVIERKGQLTVYRRHHAVGRELFRAGDGHKKPFHGSECKHQLLLIRCNRLKRKDNTIEVGLREASLAESRSNNHHQFAVLFVESVDKDTWVAT